MRKAVESFNSKIPDEADIQHNINKWSFDDINVEWSSGSMSESSPSNRYPVTYPDISDNNSLGSFSSQYDDRQRRLQSALERRRQIELEIEELQRVGPASNLTSPVSLLSHSGSYHNTPHSASGFSLSSSQSPRSQSFAAQHQSPQLQHMNMYQQRMPAFRPQSSHREQSFDRMNSLVRLEPGSQQPPQNVFFGQQFFPSSPRYDHPHHHQQQQHPQQMPRYTLQQPGYTPHDRFFGHNQTIPTTANNMTGMRILPHSVGHNNRQSPVAASSPSSHGSSSVSENRHEHKPPAYNSPQFVYKVQFKCGSRDFMPGPRVTQAVELGEFVITQCSRGEDLGVVSDIIPLQQFVEMRCLTKIASSSSEQDSVQQILRIATAEERMKLPDKLRDEQVVIDTITSLAGEKYGLEMHVINAEYQFDRLKLTIHYTSEERIDFRELVRELFGIFKSRIWMKKILPSQPPFEPKQFAALALSTGQSFRPNNHNNSF